MRPDVRQQQLDRLFQTSTSVELADWVLNEQKRTLDPRVLIRFSEPENLMHLAGLLRIQHRGNASRTFSLGECLLNFAPSGQQLTLQYGRYGLTLRAERLWRYDAPLADGPGLVQYLEERGVTVLDHVCVRSEPFPIDPALADWESPPDPPVDVVRHSLEQLQQTFPNPLEMAEHLLICSAPTSEVWDRYPGSREHMRKMLERLPTAVLIKALKNPETLNGARVLAMEWAEMPAQLRRRISSHG